MEKIHSTKLYTCEKCDKTFKSPHYYKRHQIDYHKLPDKKCDICGALFKLPRSLKAHVEVVHKGIKNHKCHKCGKAFYVEKDLRRHKICIPKVKNENTL